MLVSHGGLLCCFAWLEHKKLAVVLLSLFLSLSLFSHSLSLFLFSFFFVLSPFPVCPAAPGSLFDPLPGDLERSPSHRSRTSIHRLRGFCFTGGGSFPESPRGTWGSLGCPSRPDMFVRGRILEVQVRWKLCARSRSLGK